MEESSKILFKITSSPDSPWTQSMINLLQRRIDGGEGTLLIFINTRVKVRYDSFFYRCNLVNMISCIVNIQDEYF